MSSKTTLSFGESLDITQANSLQGRLERSLQKSSTIELKANAVEKADTAGLQLILALKNEAETRGGAISWKKPSAALLEAAQRLGLTTALGLDGLDGDMPQ